MSKKVISLKELPAELYSLFSRNHKVLLETKNNKIHITNMRVKSNVAELNGDLYYFGNTYGNINPYLKISNIKDLIDFVLEINKSMSELIKGHLTDITYLSISDIMNDQVCAEKLLTSKEVVYPDYSVELRGSQLLSIDIDDDHSVIKTDDEIFIEKVGVFDLKKLFKMEYLNSLYLVKIAHTRDLDIRGVMNLLPQLQLKKMVDIVHIVDSRESITVCLHVPENLIDQVFAYKLKKRTTKVRLDNLTPFYISKTIKSRYVL